jgi:PAS domain S-box-containing protein
MERVLPSALLDATLDCVIAIDADGRVTEWNAAAERTFGYRRHQVLGQDLADLIIPPALRERHRAGLRRYLETGERTIIGRRVELNAMRADGTEFPVELAITVLPGSDPPQFTGYLRDISERRHAEEERRHLAMIVQTTDDAVFSLDLDAHVTAWNPGAERVFGYPPEQAIGRHVSFLAPPELRDETPGLLSHLRLGQAIENYETERLRADGARITVSLTLSPIIDPVRGVTGVSEIARDITARKRSEAAKDLLAAASGALDTSLDPDTTIRTIAETAVPELAELCVIDLLGEDGSIGDPAIAAVDPEIGRELREIRRSYPLDAHGDHPVAQVMRSRQPMVIRDLAEPDIEDQVAQSDEHRAFMRRAGYNSAAVVPMLARGRMLGTLSLLHVDNDRRYDPGDLALISDLGGRAALALDNARLYAERSHIAQTLQRSLLPAALPEIPGAEIAAAFKPIGEGAEVGGDFYDVFEADGAWVLAVGDVCGKGVEAAALTSLVRYGLRAPAIEHKSPSHALSLVHTTMLGQDLGGRFATALLARLDLSQRPAKATLATAGHPAAVLIPAEGDPAPVGDRGTLLGVGLEPTINDVTLDLQPGDVLLLYTDGVLDAGAPGAVLSEAGLCRALAVLKERDAESVVRHTVELALELAGGTLRDDVAVLAIRVL